MYKLIRTYGYFSHKFLFRFFTIKWKENQMDSCDSCGRSLHNEYTIDETDAHHLFRP